MHPVTRRSALRGSAVAALGVAAGYATVRAAGVSDRSTTTAANGYGAAEATPGTVLAPLASLRSSGGIVLAARRIVLTMRPGGPVHAFSAVCTHQGCLVTSADAREIVCPCHGSRFDAATGAVLAGPATRPLPPVAVVVRDDSVYTV